MMKDTETGRVCESERQRGNMREIMRKKERKRERERERERVCEGERQLR